MAAGFDDFLLKPFNEIELFDLMSKHLGIRFVYAEDTHAAVKKPLSPRQNILTPATLAELPKELTAALRREAVALNFEATVAIIDRIRVQNEVLADALRELLDQYRFDKIEELLVE